MGNIESNGGENSNENDEVLEECDSEVILVCNIWLKKRDYYLLTCCSQSVEVTNAQGWDMQAVSLAICLPIQC